MVIMRRPKWLIGWGEGKNPLEASLLIDIPEVKVVEASFNKELTVLALGTSKQTGTTDHSEEAIKKNETEWRIFFDSTIISKCMPSEEARAFLAGIVAASTGEDSVYNANTTYIPSGDKPTKGNAPLLLDYALAKKIGEARNKKTV